MIEIVAGVLALWCLLSLPIGLLVGRSLRVAAQTERVRRAGAVGRLERSALRGLHS